MSVFTPAHLADLRDLQTACQTRRTDVAIIGAMAYRLFINDVDRETRDINLAVAIDLEDLQPFYDLLAGLGWKREPRQEQRWRTARGAWMDLLPAGPLLRAHGRMEWPRSGFSMSLAGFDHVFSDSVTLLLAPDLACKVVPPPVQALLKMASYLDDPHGRAKDLLDLRRLLRRYEYESARIFSDDVFQADLQDIELATAFLLGRDMRGLLGGNDLALVARFLSHVDGTVEHAPSLDIDGRDTWLFKLQISAFRQGLSSGGD